MSPPSPPARRDPSVADRVADALRAVWPPSRWASVTVLVGVSGGGDSVALLRTLHRLAEEESDRQAARGRLVVAHFNHALRGAESDEDERFVRRLTERLGLEGQFARADGVDSQARSEGALREARYAFFHQAAARVGARYLCLGHTRDDQAETVAQRIFRGSGVAGLGGMSAFRSAGELVIARPLLGVARQDLRQMLAELGQPYREDATNASTDATRNWLRHEILPRLGERYPGASDALARLAESAREARDALRWALLPLCERACHTVGPERVEIDLEPLRDAPAGVVLEVLRFAWHRQGWPLAAMSRLQWLRLLGAVRDRQSAPFHLPGKVHVERSGDRLVLARQ